MEEPMYKQGMKLTQNITTTTTNETEREKNR